MKATILTKRTTLTKLTTLTKSTKRSKSTALTARSKRTTLPKRKIDWMAIWVYGFLFSGFFSFVCGVAQIYLKSPHGAE